MSMIKPGGLTPNRKIVKVGDAFSPSNLKIGNQQASTRNVYDFVKVNNSGTQQTLQFFKNVNQKTFPYTNITENKFAAGESLAVLRMYLTLMLVDSAGEIDLVATPDYGPQTQKFWRSDLNLFIDNNRVIKDFSVTSFKGEFNHSSNWGALQANNNAATIILQEEATHCVFGLDDAIVIPELISFRGELTIPSFTNPYDGKDVYLGLTLEGFAALVSPKSKF
jgi:hypothetical protein